MNDKEIEKINEQRFREIVAKEAEAKAKEYLEVWKQGFLEGQKTMNHVEVQNIPFIGSSGKGLRTVLIGMDGSRHYFRTKSEASVWLGWSKSYITSRESGNRPIYHRKTKEQYRVEYEED